MADTHMRVSGAERERLLKRGGAGLAVILVHIVILLALFTAGHIRDLVRRPPQEMVLLLPPPSQAKNTKAQIPLPPIPDARPVNIPPSIQITPPPPIPPTTQKPTDVMQALGREIACGAGSYENLPQAEREVCRRQPWRFKKNAQGVIVMDKVPALVPPPDEPVTGVDAQTQIGRTTDPCVAAGSTHSECIHKTILGR